MRIGVDIRVLMDEHYSGVSEYAANLLSAILKQDKNNEYKLFYNSFHNLDDRFYYLNGENVKVIGKHWPNKIFNYLLQKILFWPKLDRVLGGVDVFWSPHFNFTSLSSASTGLQRVITVHDLSFLRYPEFFSARKNFWHRALNVKKTLQAADMIIAVSANTKNDIIELAGVPAEKIKVIYAGNNIVKRDVGEQEIQEFLVKHKLIDVKATKPTFGRFVSYLGNIEPRKNINGLIEAFNQLQTTAKENGNDLKNVKLILAGASGWKNKKIYAAWHNSPYQDDIKFLGYISKKEKEILYYISSAFVYPSFYEGFGFPPLEAMTYGLPVVCSNISSLPEVVGSAALMINPFKSDEIAQALEMVLTDESWRSKMIIEGFKRVELFSWDKAAKEYLEIFSSLKR